VVEEYWKRDCDLRSVLDEVYDNSSRLPGSNVGGDTGVCGDGMRCNGLIGGAAVLLVANGIIRTAKQLPEVSRDCGVGQGCTLAGWGFL